MTAAYRAEAVHATAPPAVADRSNGTRLDIAAKRASSRQPGQPAVEHDPRGQQHGQQRDEVDARHLEGERPRDQQDAQAGEAGPEPADRDEDARGHQSREDHRERQAGRVEERGCRERAEVLWRELRREQEHHRHQPGHHGSGRGGPAEAGPAGDRLQPVRGGQPVDQPVQQEPGQPGQHQRGGERRTRRREGRGVGDEEHPDAGEHGPDPADRDEARRDREREQHGEQRAALGVQERRLERHRGRDAGLPQRILDDDEVRDRHRPRG